MLLPMAEATVGPGHSGPSAIQAENQADPRAEGLQPCVHTHPGKLSVTQAWAHAWLAAHHTWLCRERAEKFSRDIFILHAGVSTVGGEVCTPD